MKTFDDYWQEFAGSCLASPDEYTRYSSYLAFVTGASVLFFYMQKDIAALPDEEAMRALESMQAQLAQARDNCVKDTVPGAAPQPAVQDEAGMMQTAAEDLEALLDGRLYCLLVVEQGERQVLHYVSNAERSSVITAMQQFISQNAQSPVMPASDKVH